MNYQIEYAWFCHGGNVRPNNEDNIWIQGELLPMEHEGGEKISQGVLMDHEGPVFGVFDGMGGESCGEAASFIGAKSLGDSVKELSTLQREKPGDFLKEACNRMNQEVLDFASDNRIRTMGSTVALAAFGENEIGVGNLGDSRIYSLFQGKWEQVSEDHVLTRSFFGKAPLTQYLGLPQDEMVLEPHIACIPYRADLRLLLCSDGVTDMISSRRLRDLMGGENCAAVAESLLKEGLSAGGRDNLTAVVIRILPGEMEGDLKPKHVPWYARFFSWGIGKENNS